MTPNEWTAGMMPERDLVFPACPENPDMRESVSLWFVSDDGQLAFPRCGIEAEAQCWDDRMFQFNCAFPSGRVLIGPSRGAPPSPMDADGKPAIIGAGPLTFQCLEPFKRWRASFDGVARDGHVTDQIAGTLALRPESPIAMNIDMVMAVPAWGQEMEAGSEEADFMGIGYRFEQLFRAEGQVTLDGETRDFKGTGLRIHRQSVRHLAGFWGHCWQSALFPDGSAFGYIAYPPRDDGKETYNEGFVYLDGRMHAARMVEAPWLRRVMPSGDDVSLVLESDLGLTRIKGTTKFSTFRIGNQDMGGLHLQQCGVQYEWDGQQTYGMIERSSAANLVEFV